MGVFSAVQVWLNDMFGRRNTRATMFPRQQLHQLIGVVENKVGNELASGQFSFDSEQVLTDQAAVEAYTKNLADSIEFVLRGYIDWQSFSVAIRKLGTGA